MPLRVECVKGDAQKDGTIYSYFCAGIIVCAENEFPIMFRANQNLNEIAEIILSVACYEDELPTVLPCLQVFAAAHGGNVWAEITGITDLPKAHHVLLLFLGSLPTLSACMKKAEYMLAQLELFLRKRDSISIWTNRHDQN